MYIQDLKKFIYYYPYETGKLITLLGLITLYKELNYSSFQEIVNNLNLESKYFAHLIDDLLDDDSFESKLEGKLYNDLLELRLWFEDYMLDQEINGPPVKPDLLDDIIKLVS